MKRTILCLLVFFAMVFPSRGEEAVVDVYRIDPVIASAVVILYDGEKPVEKAYLEPRRSEGLFTAGEGTKMEVSLYNIASEEVVRLELELKEDRIFTGRVTENKSQGLIACAITDQVVVCCTTPSRQSLVKYPLLVLWPNDVKLFAWRLPEVEAALANK